MLGTVRAAIDGGDCAAWRFTDEQKVKLLELAELPFVELDRR